MGEAMHTAAALLILCPWFSVQAPGEPAAGGATARQDAEGTPNPAPSRAVTRERIQRNLEAITKAAERLRDAAESQESRDLAERIRWLADTLRGDMERALAANEAGKASDPSTDGSAGESASNSGAAPDVPARRADPDSFRPVATRNVRNFQWGFNPTEIPPGGTRDRTFVGEDFRSISRGGAVMVTLYGQHRNFRFQDCIFQGAPDDKGVIRTRWGIRAYDVIDWTFQHCEWRNIPDEHGCYLNAPGPVTWRECKFSDIGSQAIQVVYRTGGGYEHETTDPTLRNLGGLQAVDGCLFLEVGKPTGGRPSYAISFFEGPACPVRIQRCFLRTHHSPHLDARGMPSQSFGAIMVHDRPKFELLDTTIDYLKPDRDVVQIWNVNEVVIENCEIREGTIELRNCQKVRIAGNRGGAKVVIGTGPTYTWPMASVKREGPISQDWSQ